MASDSMNNWFEGVQPKLNCAHNHPDQKPDEPCKLCGLPPQNEDNINGQKSG